MKSGLSDAHLHFCDHTRLPELQRFIKRLAVERVGLVSLPVPDRINFNPELLLAKAELPGCAWILPALDHSARLFARQGEAPDLGGQVRELQGMGCDGIKIFAGKPEFQRRLALKLDGPLFAAAFRAAASLDLPVLMHVADPPAFFAAGETPGYEELQGQALRVLKAHPDCVFIFPHLLMMADDLERLSVLLEAHGNLFLDLAPGRYFYAELSRRREEARDFFRRFSDRILFGSDGFWFPPGFDLFTPADLAENLGRARLLLDFLTGDADFDNPFPPTREAYPRVRGLKLEQRVLDRILGLNFTRGLGERPRPLDRPAGLAYLEGFRERLEQIGPEAVPGGSAAVEAAAAALKEAA
jgi:hypothetical protein